MRSLIILKIINNKKGFSLVEILIAASILAVVSYGAVHILNILMKGQKTAEAGMEVLELRKNIVSTLSNRAACQRTFGIIPNIFNETECNAESGNWIDEKSVCLNNSREIKIGDHFNDILGKNGDQLVSVGNIIGHKKLKITEISTVDEVDLGDGLRKIDLLINFENLAEKNSYGANKVLRTKLIVQAESPGARITNCIAGDKNVYGKQCNIGEALRGFDNNGEVICDPITPTFEHHLYDTQVDNSTETVPLNPSSTSYNEWDFCSSAGWSGPGSNDSKCRVEKISGEWRLRAEDIDTGDEEVTGSTRCYAICTKMIFGPPAP